MNSKPVWKVEKIVLPQHADHAGLMWHGNYFNWLEESRINALSEVGISYFELTKNGLDLPLILFPISFANKLFVLENNEKTNTHKNKIILFIKKNLSNTIVICK